MATLIPLNLFNQSGLSSQTTEEFLQIFDQAPDLHDAYEAIITSGNKDVVQAMTDDLNSITAQANLANPLTNSMENRIVGSIDDVYALPALSFTQINGIDIDSTLIYTGDDIVEAAQQYAVGQIQAPQVMATIIALVSQSRYLFLSAQLMIHSSDKFLNDLYSEFKKDQANGVFATSDAKVVAKFETQIREWQASYDPIKAVYMPTDELAQWFGQFMEDNKEVYMLPSTIFTLNTVDDKNQVFALIDLDLLLASSKKQIEANLSNLEATAKLAAPTLRSLKMKELLSAQQVVRNATTDKKGFGRDDEVSRSRSQATKKVLKTTNDKTILHWLDGLIKQMPISKYATNNVKKIRTSTYARPNRREPDNQFKPGVKTTYQYRPDLHVYIDTSGSMNVDAYESAMHVAILIAKRLKSDLYITSFSDRIAQPIKLDKVQSQSTKKLWSRIQKMPTVGGGTDFTNVYSSIDLRAKDNVKHGKLPEFNIIASDLMYEFDYSYEIPKSAKSAAYVAVDTGYSDDLIKDWISTLEQRFKITNINKRLIKLS